MLLSWAYRLMKSFKIERNFNKPKLKFGLFKPLYRFIPFISLLLFTFVFAKIFYEIEIAFCPSKWGSLDYYSNKSKSLTYWKAFHYIAIIDTTIGFGDIEPCSVWGQAFSILAAFFGIPLTLLCLTKLGFVFEVYLNKFWLFMRKRTKRSSKVYASNATSLSIIIEEDNEIETDRTAIVVPLWFGLFVTFLWILFCSLYFYVTLKPNYKQQNFTIFTAFYFTIITFFTIGLGDVAPTQYEYILITYLFILIGLALVTMCIDILQDKLDSLFDSMVKMINDQYQQSVIQGEDQQNMSQHVVDVKNNVKEMLKSGNDRSWMKHFMSKKDKRKLVEQYQNKAKMKVRGTQHDTVYEEKPTQHDTVYEEKPTQHDTVYEEKTTLTDVAYLDKDTMTDLTLVPVQSIGINVRVSHLHAVGHLESLISP